MMSGGMWRALPAGTDAPPLFVKTNFNDTGYRIQITDLSRLWGETLSKDGIVDRASDFSCSIDPSEDDQYRILLEKISAALKSEKGTTLVLRAHRDGQGLEFDITASLPGSLPDFQWNVSLSRLPDDTVESDLVTPLLIHATHLKHQVHQLIDEIASKDRVISKLADRMESAGTDLTTVFPGASNIKTNKKRSQREQLANHVRGLANFDEETWRETVVRNDDTEGQISGSMNEIFEEITVPRSVPTSDAPKWWKTLRLAPSGAQLSGPTRDGQHREKTEGFNDLPAPMSRDNSTVDDEFQRQATPTRLRSTEPPPVPEDADTETETHGSEDQPSGKPDADDESTADEGDLDAPPSRGSSQIKGSPQQIDIAPVSSTSSRPSVRKLGVIEGKKSSVATKSAGPKLGGFKGTAKSGTPPPAMDPEPASDMEAEEIRSSKPRSKLGTFGGRKAATRPSPEPASEPVDAPAKPKHKLGAFGGKGSARIGEVSERNENSAPETQRPGSMGKRHEKETVNPAPVEAGERKSRPSMKEEVKQERDNSEERADKARERLKRELDEKTKVPTKKKRKF